MNKKQKRILFRKILPKTILLLVLVVAVISFITLKIMGNNAEDEIKDWNKNGGNQATQIAIDKFDYLKIDNIKIKYPSTYKLTQQQGNEDIGEYILIQNQPQDQLIIGYEPKELAGKKYTTVDEVLKSHEEIYIEYLKANKKVIPESSGNKKTKIGNFIVHYVELSYENNTLYVYVFESEKHIIRLTSHLKYFLDSIIKNLDK